MSLRLGSCCEEQQNGGKFALTANHYVILFVVGFSVYWVVISLINMIERKKRIRAKRKTWGKLNEISERLKVEKGLKVWESLGNSNEEKENIR